MSEFKPHQKPEALTDDLADIVRDILDQMPPCEEVSWDLHPHTFVLRVKRPKEDPSKDLSWANQMAKFFVRSHAIACRLWADRLAREAEVERMREQCETLDRVLGHIVDETDRRGRQPMVDDNTPAAPSGPPPDVSWMFKSKRPCEQCAFEAEHPGTQLTVADCTCHPSIRMVKR